MAVKETPIIFKGIMVNAIYKLIKTHTRRLKGLKEINKAPDEWAVIPDATDEDIWWFKEADPVNEHHPHMLPIKCPYGQVGDRLWVRETFLDTGTNSYTKRKKIQTLFYAASLPIPKENLKQFKGKWKPSIHMPRWACRLELEIIDIRLERLQDISDEDAKAEGVIVPKALKMLGEYYTGSTHKVAFNTLWDSINAAAGYGWEKNPYVWVIVFKILEGK
jgi:hypothetical protein